VADGRFAQHLGVVLGIPFVVAVGAALVASAVRIHRAVVDLPTFPILYRFTIEQLVKNPPMYGPYNADNGMWHPWVNWRRRRIENLGLRNTYREKFGKKEQGGQ